MQTNLATSPHVRAILLALQRAQAALRRAPARSNGRRAVEAKLAEAMRLVAPLMATTGGEVVGDAPEVARQAIALAREAMMRQAQMGAQILTMPVAQIRQLWGVATLPETTIREIGRVISQTARDAMVIIDRNFPVIASTWGNVVGGLGAGSIIALAIVGFLLLKK